MNNLKLVTLSSLLMILAGCHSFGPVPAQLSVDSTIQLKAESGRIIELNSGTDRSVHLSYDGMMKKFTLATGGEKFVFRKAKEIQEENRIVASPESSGQNVGGTFLGLQASENVVCNPHCEQVSTEVRDQTCTRYEHRQVQQCHSHNGHVSCTTFWQDIAIPGWQRVEHRYTTRTLHYTASIYSGNSSATLASASGEKTSTSLSTRAIGACY